MKAKLKVSYDFRCDFTWTKGSEVIVYENLTADARDVLNIPEGMCYLCEKDGEKEYVPVKYLDITDYTPTKVIDWEQRRFELVKALSSSVCSSVPLENCTDKQLAEVIISLADEVIKQLKNELIKEDNQ